MSPICGTHLFLGITSTKVRHSEASPFRKLIPPPQSHHMLVASRASQPLGNGLA